MVTTLILRRTRRICRGRHDEYAMKGKVVSTGFRICIVVAVLAGCVRAESPRAFGTASDQQPARSTVKSKVWLESINSVSRQSLQPSGLDIEYTPSRMATRLVKRGSGKRYATNADAIVLYSQVYDSAGRVAARGSELVGDPTRDLNKLGQEAIHMMVEGEVRCFWFPDPKKRSAIKVTDYELVWISPQPGDSPEPHQ